MLSYSNTGYDYPYAQYLKSPIVLVNLFKNLNRRGLSIPSDIHQRYNNGVICSIKTPQEAWKRNACTKSFEITRLVLIIFWLKFRMGMSESPYPDILLCREDVHMTPKMVDEHKFGWYYTNNTNLKSFHSFLIK